MGNRSGLRPRATRPRYASPASDTSELSVLERTPSPPPQLGSPFQPSTIKERLRRRETRQRYTSPDLSDSSEASVLSRSPSSSPEASGLLSPSPTPPQKQGGPKQRGPNGRLFSRSPETPRSSVDRPGKQKSAKKVTPKAKPSTTSASPRMTAPSHTNSPVDGLGVLRPLPLELRQMIYGFALDIDDAVSPKECCGPGSTPRERAGCKKHGNTSKKLFRMVDEEGYTGKFNLLLVSKEVKLEASWVLYNQGSLLIKINGAIVPYLTGLGQKTIYRLRDVPKDEKVKAMWTVAARFRRIKIEIPAQTLESDNPMVYTALLNEAASLLLKAWDDMSVSEKSAVTHAVNVHLGSLFTQTVPFNMSGRDSGTMRDVLIWSLLHHPANLPGFDDVADECAYNLERVAAVVGHHKGTSEWKFVAMEVNDEKEGANQLRALQSTCWDNDLEFETEPAEDSDST